MVTVETPEFLSWWAKVKAQSAWIITYKQGAAYIRVHKYDESGELSDMPYCFIDRATGNVLRAANWRFPSKKFARGNLFDELNGMGSMDPEGPQALKAGCPLGFKYDHKRKVPVRVKKHKPEGADYIEEPDLIKIPVDPPFVPYPAPKIPSVRTWTQEDKSFWNKEDY